MIANARYHGRNPDNNPFEPPGLSGQVHYFDPAGNPLMKWPSGSLNGNPDFGRGDWKGDGSHDVFWLKYHLEPDGRGTLYFAQEVYHMFDFMGNGAEQVICINRGMGILQVYGYRNAPQRTAKRDSEYLRHSMVNHTHY